MPGSNWPDSQAYPHFALIYIDRGGNLRREVSSSIAHHREIIFSPRVTNLFLRAVSQSAEISQLPSHCKYIPLRTTCWIDPGHTVVESNAQPTPIQRVPSDENSLWQQISHFSHYPGIQGFPGHPAQPVSELRATGASTQQREKSWNEDLGIANQKATISVRDRDILRRYYEKVFINLQQTNCRVIAKAYIKRVEPRKQVLHPYNGRKILNGNTQQFHPDETKPLWWPSGVSHREPDHLPKAGEIARFPTTSITADRQKERIRLLVHILTELRTSHGITAQRLREADQTIRRQISPVERLQILDEVYRVREEEEKFLDGESGTVVLP